MPFLFLEHTADIQAECRAADFEGLLKTAAQAMYAVALKELRETKDETRRVSVNASCREELLVRWLHELLYLIETEHFVATESEFGLLNDESLDATLQGYICEADERAEEIKAVTYHELAIEESPEGLTARVIFDM